MVSSRNPNNPPPPWPPPQLSLDLHQFYHPTTTPSSSHPPPTLPYPFHHHLLYPHQPPLLQYLPHQPLPPPALQPHQQQQQFHPTLLSQRPLPLPFPTPPQPPNPNSNFFVPNSTPGPNPGPGLNTSPNVGARLMALLGSLPQPLHPSSSGEFSGSSPPANPPPLAPVRMVGSKKPHGGRLSGDYVACDVDARDPTRPPSQLEVTPISKYISDPQLELGRQIAVNHSYICYGPKQGNIRVLNSNTALRSLLSGHTQVETHFDPTNDLRRLISEFKYDEAFTAALQRSDVSIVSWLCAQVDLHRIVSMASLPLSQGVLLSLLQQLACDINKDTPRKLAWMMDVAGAINTSDPVISMQVRPIFEQVYKKLSHQRNLPMEAKGKRIKYYTSSDRILLVGEGDLSFAVSLARDFGSAVNIVATTLDSRERVLAQYSRAYENLKELEELRCDVVHKVNAHTMSEHPLLSARSFDKIVFNFPHAGFLLEEDSPFQIEWHQNLVRGFFKSASGMLASKGEVHVTHKTTYPFSAWNIVSLAKNFDLRLVGEDTFHLGMYPGYLNKRGEGYLSDSSFPVWLSSTYKFALC